MGGACFKREIYLLLRHNRGLTNSYVYPRPSLDNTNCEGKDRPDRKGTGLSILGTNNSLGTDVGDSKHNELDKTQLANGSHIQDPSLLPHLHVPIKDGNF